MNRRKIYLFFSMSVFTFTFLLFQNFTTISNSNLFNTAVLRQIPVTLDNGQKITAWTFSNYLPADVQKMVLIADRSTVNGCPYSKSSKGLIHESDIVYVSNNYLAWFDYSKNVDGNQTTNFAKSGSLVGFWSLDSQSKSFKYPINKEDTAKGICKNWARNELISGSNSPQGENYWWDKYAPALEHTIVVKNKKVISKSTDYLLFGSIYAQHLDVNISSAKNPPQLMNGNEVHLAVKSKLTSWGGNGPYTTQVPAADNTFGEVESEVRHILKDTHIEVVWSFKSTKDLELDNIYVNLWMAYASLNNRSTTCHDGVIQEYPVPAQQYQSGSFANSYNFVSSNISLYSIESDGGLTESRPYQIVQFPWQNYRPCGGMNGGIKTDYRLNQLAGGTYLQTGYAANQVSPYWQFTYLSKPCVGADCGSVTNPMSYPFNRMMINYESGDQQQGFIITRELDSEQKILAGKNYRVRYAISNISINPQLLLNNQPIQKCPYMTQLVGNQCVPIVAPPIKPYLQQPQLQKINQLDR